MTIPHHALSNSGDTAAPPKGGHCREMRPSKFHDLVLLSVGCESATAYYIDQFDSVSEAIQSINSLPTESTLSQFVALSLFRLLQHL